MEDHFFRCSSWLMFSAIEISFLFSEFLGLFHKAKTGKNKRCRQRRIQTCCWPSSSFLVNKKDDTFETIIIWREWEYG